MSFLLDARKLQALLDILQNDHGTPEDAPEERQRAQRQGLPRQQNAGPQPAPAGPPPAPAGPQQAPAGPPPATSGPPPATSGPPPATSGPPPATAGPLPASPPSPPLPATSSSPPLSAGSPNAHHSPAPIVNNESGPDVNQQPVVPPGNQQPVVPPGNQQPVVPPGNQQPVVPPGNQQADNAYVGFAIHGLTRGGFNRSIMRYKAVSDLTFKEYMCMLMNRNSFDIRNITMDELREGVFLYQVARNLHEDRVVSSGNADGQQWNQQHTIRRRFAQVETIQYTQYQCIGNTNWTKKVYQTSSENDWVVVHYRYSGDIPVIDSMVRCVNDLRQTFVQFRDEDAAICAELVTAVQP